ncbi:MAG: class I SAM-dependent methyltransferase [Candidatus Thiodiazotropha sp. LLP2]
MDKSVSGGMRKFILSMIPNSDRLRYLLHKPVMEDWKKKSGQYPFFEQRFEMYDYVNNEVLKNCEVDYLEFGVFKGDSIKYFSELNQQSGSRFVGFDTFEGLPEDWVEFSRTVKKETFTTEGNLPAIDDDRVSFVKGLFQDSLPGFLETFKPDKQLLIHNDSDLYSATLYVLTYMNQYLKPGTVIIFDEFYSVLDEFRALQDYTSAYMKEYEVIAATNDHVQVAVRIL